MSALGGRQGHVIIDEYAFTRRGYRPLYQPAMLCPGCGRSNWHVGRQAAECGFCATALPLAPPAREDRDPA